jgi:hypothetical protein
VSGNVAGIVSVRSRGAVCAVICDRKELSGSCLVTFSCCCFPAIDEPGYTGCLFSALTS